MHQQNLSSKKTEKTDDAFLMKIDPEHKKGTNEMLKLNYIPQNQKVYL